MTRGMTTGPKLVGGQRRSLTPEQARLIRDLVERGLSGEFDRVTIDFRGRSFYVDTLRRTSGTIEHKRAA